MTATAGRRAMPYSSTPEVLPYQTVFPEGVYALTTTDTQGKLSIVGGVLHFAPADLGSPFTLGTLVKTDTANKLTVGSSSMTFAGGKSSPAYGDPGIWSPGAYARAAGRALFLRLNKTGGTALRFGWDSDQAGSPSIAAGISGTSIYAPFDDSGALTDAVGSITASTNWDLAIILRAAGHFLIGRPDDGSPWQLLWVSNRGTSTPFYAAIANFDAVDVIDNYREGDLGGLFASDFGIATGHVAGSVAINTFLTQTPDADVEFTIDTMHSAGSLSVEVRSGSAGSINAWYVQVNSTGSGTFRKRVNSVDTTLITTNQMPNGTFFANCRVVVKMIADLYRIYVNGVLKGTTSGDSTFAANTIAGVTNLGTGAVVKDFSTWPHLLSIGTSGDPAGFDVATTRTAGIALRGTVNLDRNDQAMYVGWNTTGSGGPDEHATGFGARGLIQILEGGSIWETAEAYSASTDYELLLVLRGTGCFHLIRGGAYTSWTLIWVSNSLTTSPLYPMLEAFAASGTFRAYGRPDVGSRWDTDYGIATGRIAGTVALDSWIPHLPDGTIRWTLTTLPISSTAAVSFRAAQTHQTVTTWYVPVSSDGSGSLRERFNNVDTIHATFAAGTFTNNTRVSVILNGTTITVYAGNAQLTSYTGASTLTGNVAAGVTVLGPGSVISDLVSFPRNPVVTLDGVQSSSIYSANIVWDGDSLTWGYLGSSGADYPHQVVASLSQRVAWRNDAISGQTLAMMQSDAATEIDPAVTTDIAKNILVIWGGTNDIALDGVSAATAYSRLTTYCNARKAAGWTIVVLTMIPRGSTSSWETNRIAYNALITANYRTFADVLVDLAADPVFAAGQQANTTYYNGDKTHLTDVGYAYVGGLATAALSALGVS